MFSTSMIASSTTSPSAMTKPANTIVLIVAPHSVSTTTAAINDSGIAVRLMSAVRQSNKKTIRITTTSTHPMNSAWLRLLSARSMNVAGRKMVGSTSTSFSPGRSASSAASTRRVTSSVFPSGCFSTINNSPGPSLMIASPIGGGEPMTTSATSPSRIGVPSRKSTTDRAKSSGSTIAVMCRIARRWFGVSTNPPASKTVASPAARTTCSSVTPCARNRSGSTST